MRPLNFPGLFHRNLLCKEVANVSVLKILDRLNKSEWALSIMGM